MLARSMTLLSLVSLIGCGTADLDDTDERGAPASRGGSGAVRESSLDFEIGFGGTSNPGGLGDVGGAPSSVPNPSLGASDDPRAPKMPSVSCLISPPKVTFSWPEADFRVAEGGCPTEANCGYRVYARRSMETTYTVTSVPMTAASATVSYSMIPTDYYVSAFNRFGDSGLTYAVSVQ